MKNYTVAVTKKDGMSSIYYVTAMSAGGAETAVLASVYNAQYALATIGWPPSNIYADLITEAAMVADLLERYRLMA